MKTCVSLNVERWREVWLANDLRFDKIVGNVQATITLVIVRYRQNRFIKKMDGGSELA